MAELTTISSRDNSRLKFARRVRDGREPQLMFIEGRRLCRDAVASPIDVVEAFVTGSFIASDPKFIELLRQRDIDVFTISEDLLCSIADTRSPQGVILVARRPARASIDDILKRSSDLPAAVYLFEVNDPSNVGAVARTAEAAGAAGFATSGGSADLFSPKALRASMGSAFRLPVAFTSHSEAIQKARSFGRIVTAVDLSGTCRYTEIDWSLPRLLIFGSEAAGLPEDVLASTDEIISIPMSGGVESLNLAVSCGIVLFEAKRRSTER